MTTMKKKGRSHKKLREQEDAKSMLLPIEQLLELDGLFEGKICHLSFDIPINLRTALNNECESNGDSACKVLLRYASLYILASRVKKLALGNTLSKILDPYFCIEQVNFNQYCQTRPRRWINQRPNVALQDGVNEFCDIGSGNRVCKNRAVDILIFQPKGKPPQEHKVCAYHSAEFVKLAVWKYKQRIEKLGEGTNCA